MVSQDFTAPTTTSGEFYLYAYSTVDFQDGSCQTPDPAGIPSHGPLAISIDGDSLVGFNTQPGYQWLGPQAVHLAPGRHTIEVDEYVEHCSGQISSAGSMSLTNTHVTLIEAPDF